MSRFEQRNCSFFVINTSVSCHNSLFARFFALTAYQDDSKGSTFSDNSSYPKRRDGQSTRDIERGNLPIFSGLHVSYIKRVSSHGKSLWM
ncbi:hypothetical protein X975_15182, partial [Stegodyphus mimosarum]